jgi:protein-tyrosine phosphatase
MDRFNRDDLLAMAPDAAAESRVRMLREFGDHAELDVPDPYDGGANGFAEVVEIVERNCTALLEEIRAGRLA